MKLKSKVEISTPKVEDFSPDEELKVKAATAKELRKKIKQNNNSLDAQTKEALLKASQIIEEKGWCRGHFQNEKGAVCFHGALSIAIYGDARSSGTFLWSPGHTDSRAEVEYNAVMAFQKQIRKKVIDPKKTHDIMICAEWNDSKRSSKQKVLEGLKKAADSL